MQAVIKTLLMNEKESKKDSDPRYAVKYFKMIIGHKYSLNIEALNIY